MSFTAGNTERMRIISSSGNVGIGTTQTDANLRVHGVTNSSTKISAGMVGPNPIYHLLVVMLVTSLTLIN